ncbi:MAG TPA: HWE histidine kinase domain-containing protein [Microvirga sp.]|jgi:PAS domain S-box-containing protein|nr:HWE histidine kinase domain-containing protein [Microvirga sp.]
MKDESALSRFRLDGPDSALFRAAVEAAGEAVIITSPDLDPPGPTILYVNPAFTRLTQYAAAEVIGRTPRILQGPATSRSELDRMRAELARHGTFDGEVVNHRPDGSRYVIQWTVTAVRDEAGRVVNWVSVQRDVTERQEALARQRFLVAELQNRVRNTLSVVRSLVRRTAETARTVDDYVMHLDGRLDAFSRVQSNVTRDPSAGVDLSLLVADELLAHAIQEGERFNLDGPGLRLRPKAAAAVGLAVHELTAGALDRGVLSAPRGRIQVTWRIDADGAPARLHFRWSESGVSGPVPAAGDGRDGSDLLDRILAYELGGRVTRGMEAGGLRCTIEIPLSGELLAAPVP